MTWLIAVLVALVLIGLWTWAARGRGASDEERSADWARGPSDGGGLGGF